MHLVVSAHKLEGGRLNIRKTDLRRYREQFARQLRAQGVEANATPAQMRGRLSDHQKDGVYRAAQRGTSWVEWQREARAAKAASDPDASLGVRRIVETKESVQRDWLRTVAALERQGLAGLAAEAERFRQSLRFRKARPERTALALRKGPPERSPRQLELVR